jgi:glutamate synthase (ferredoxin)
VGVATQNPKLREKFEGKAEHVVNFFKFIAEEVRETLASLGYRSLDEIIGRVDLLDTKRAVDHWKAQGLDLSAILYKPDVDASVATRKVREQDHGLEKALDQELLKRAAKALETGEKVTLDLPIRNTNRTVGTMLGSELTRKYGFDGLADDTVEITFRGSAGQSFGAFVPRGMTLRLWGDSNDYTGKGLSGGKLIVRPPEGSTFVPEENILIGNVALYGATGGAAFFRGIAGERFCVRNSGAITVVEGIGDHGCEYMTGGRAVIIGKTGRNFGAGMSGGIAYVWDADGQFPARCNMEMIDLEALDDSEELDLVRGVLERHLEYTGSTVARGILGRWPDEARKFVKVMPVDYRRVLMQREAERATADAAAGGGGG